MFSGFHSYTEKEAHETRSTDHADGRRTKYAETLDSRKTNGGTTGVASQNRLARSGWHDEQRHRRIAEDRSQNSFALAHAVRRTAAGGHRKRLAARRTAAGSANANRSCHHREDHSGKARRRDALEHANLGQGVGHIVRDGAARLGGQRTSTASDQDLQGQQRSAFRGKAAWTWWGCISIRPNMPWCFARTKRLRSKRWTGRNAGCRFIGAVAAR